mgnify:CR=1 FL=1
MAKNNLNIYFAVRFRIYRFGCGRYKGIYFSGRTLYDVRILTIYLSQGGALRAYTVFLTAEAL